MSLEPEYDEDSHGTYSSLLIHELEKTGPRAPRSIALTGPYGSGKSSVIDRVKTHFGDRAISISLPTLGDGVIEEKRDTSRASDSNRFSKTNIVQKEIVKQLLYIEKPTKMRGSRFQRIAPMRWSIAIALSLAVGLAAAVALYATDALASVVALLPAHWLSAWAVHLVAMAAIVAVALIVQSALHNRVTLQEVASGSASIKLTSASTNYFDEYLDEIVYFFERTEAEIVIFEDLDRFNEPHIFETLKELNGLLNGSKQLRRKKTVRFVYAIRDSVFDLERTPGGTDVGDGSERAKFFGAIIPLVPFITHRSSAALLLQVLGQNAPSSSMLIETVAAHLTDMRLIKNIRNEWEVFRRRILSTTGLQGLDADKLFAMVVYKNLHPGDFEKIRSGSSSLDVAFRAATDTVQQNSDRLAKEALDLRDRAKSQTAETRAAELGVALRSIFDQIFPRLGHGAPTDFRVGSASFAPVELETPAFWRRLNSNGAKLTVTFLTVRNYQQQTASLEFSREEIWTFLGGLNLDLDQWEREASETLRRRANSLMDERQGLESMSLSELLSADQLYEVVLTSDDLPLLPVAMKASKGQVVFNRLIAELFTDPLTTALLQAELIDLNFTLYSSEFKDARISAAAMTYFIRFVQKHEANLLYAFDEVADIEGLVKYAGLPALEGRSLYNVQILDHLLTGSATGGPLDEAVHLVSSLATGTTVDRAFLYEYVERSENALALLHQLAPLDRDIFAWLVDRYGEDPRLPSFLSSALAGASNRPYDTNAAVRKAIEGAPEKLPVFSKPAAPETADSIATAVARLGVEFLDLRQLHASLRAAVIDRHAFAITEANLRDAAPESGLSLDDLRSDDPPLAEHMLAHLADYVEVIHASHGTRTTIRDSGQFAAVLWWVNGKAPALVERVAELASTECTADDISEIAETLWGAVARAGRVRPTLSNLKALMESAARGAMSAADLEQLLARVPSIEVDPAGESFAAELQGLVLLAANMTPEQKVRLLVSMGDATSIDIGDVAPDDSELVARLVEAGRLPDTADTFAHVRGYPRARAAFMAQSPGFPAFVNDTELDASDLQSIAGNEAIPDNVRTAVLFATGSFDRGNQRTVDELLRFATANGSNVQTRLLVRAVELGAARDRVMALVPINIGARNIGSLTALLVALGGEYAKLATAGSGTAKLIDDPAHRSLVGRLQVDGFAGKIAEDRGNPTTMVVYRRRGAAG
ncbi:YobI family P-loop NTPase [Naasia lichenicola]|uniref:YobI-like P-loop NTPase domain-containing protein n=1 Tax=Naasia lichenicola TaxID=2565933 RepID=A0A4S4FSI0_9MICO|nr:hypothetical protein [Naasia lichenicola]THG32862.1 hypothetical protein E6C64_00325 [Naasia lichenicola]